MGKRNRTRAESLILNLPQLQNLIKRDPASYTEEFRQQYRHFESSLNIFRLKPDEEATQFTESVTFISHVAQCYKKECEGFPQIIMDLLANHYQVMNPDTRKSFVSSLILMRNKDLISNTSLLSLFFTLFRCRDKALRQLLHTHIVTDIKNANAKHKNNKLNKTLQNFMYTMLKDDCEIAAKKSLDVMIDLYKKQIWNDQKTVNVISEACFSESPKIIATALHFFLGADQAEDEDSDDENVPDINQIKHVAQINRKTKSRKNAMQRMLNSIKRKERSSKKAEHFNFSALHLLNDPQGFAEKLFSRLRHVTTTSHVKFEIRLAFMNLISRLIGIHKLIILGFYPFLMKYINPHQREVTAVLAYAAQASHELVPPNDMEPLVKCIADRFVWGNAANEVITAGLNGIRMICERCPLAMGEDLIRGLLLEAKQYKDKGVRMAARSLLSLYREINPELLARKDRGKTATMALKDESVKKLQYGAVNVAEGIAGAEVLASSDDEEDDEDNEEAVSGDEDEWLDLLSEGENDDESDEEAENVQSAEKEEDDSDDEEQDDEGEEFNWDEWEVASMDGEGDDEDGNEDGWVEVSGSDEEQDGHDEEEDAEDNNEEESEKSTALKSNEPETETTIKKKSKVPIEATKILTDEDFKRIRRAKLKAEAERVQGVKRKRTKTDDGEAQEDDSGEEISESDDGSMEESEDEGPQDYIDPTSLLAGVKKKNDRESRLASIMAGREGREKYGSRKGMKKAEKGASTTNREKKKAKPFMMHVHKKEIAGKRKRSLKAKTKALREHIKKQKIRM